MQSHVHSIIVEEWRGWYSGHLYKLIGKGEKDINMCHVLVCSENAFVPTGWLAMRNLAGFHLENFIRGGSSVIIMKGGHDQMKSRYGFYSKLEYCEGVFEEIGGEVGELWGGGFPPRR